MNLRDKLQQLEEASADLDGDALEETLEEYARVTKRYEHIDGYNLEARIKRVLIGLGYKEDWWEKDATTLSGGQKLA